ncbi:phospholipase A-2-activating protein [Vigna unguiculata]|uniref:Phospholipase A-2-activating protein n=1 Tax=Vigna unguiculata TaxID=3917 RepID=A0A4D6M0J0_VIGUN|nr:phospholipase A-2-activating protein [Vigna unguiculata]
MLATRLNQRIHCDERRERFLHLSGNDLEVRRNQNTVKVKHFDAVSTLSLDKKEGLLYSGSWHKTVKVWRVADFKCLESINVHDDAVNAVVAMFGGCMLTGSADGTVKMWRRVIDEKGKKLKHVLDWVLLKQERMQRRARKK